MSPRSRLAVILAIILFGLVDTTLAVDKGITGRWLGQDGKDFLGGVQGSGPSEIQDIHIEIRGLPSRPRVEGVVIHGHGGGEWVTDPKSRSAPIHLVRSPRGSSIDLYLEPYMVEKGREFTIHLKFETGRESVVYVKGAAADPNLRMPNAVLQVKWGGQPAVDRTGIGPNVGPDGLRDVRLELSRLSTKSPVHSVLIESEDRVRRRFGPNHEGDDAAELILAKDDQSRGELFFQSRLGSAPKSFDVVVKYNDEHFDRARVVAGRIDPSLKMPTPSLPRISTIALRANAAVRREGSSVLVEVEGLPRQPVIAAELSDGKIGSWVYRREERVKFVGSPGHGPLGFHVGADPTRATLRFEPRRDEFDATMTLRLLLVDGRQAVGTFPGFKCDPDAGLPRPSPSEVVANPGDDLQTLVDRGGTVRLSPGMYRLSRPLTIHKPLTLKAEPTATLVFSQNPSDPPWTTAVKIHASSTTLEGFAIRFEGKIRWDQDVSYGPAVIGTTLPGEQVPEDRRAGLTFKRLDLESPPPSTAWEDSLRLMRLMTATSGRIEGNALRGGLIEFQGGPWIITDNEHRGTPAGTFTHGVFAAHGTHDLVVSRNRVKPTAGSGKTYRFLVMTHRGENDVIKDNELVGIGPREDDAVPHPNAPETILTESYRVHFEGKPAAVSSDRRLVAIVAPQGSSPAIGSVVAVLDGPSAGAWRRVTQVLAPNQYLLDSPLPSGTEAISISTGFVRETFENNLTDARGSTIANPLMLCGSHFGTRVRSNRILGGCRSLLLLSTPTEEPVRWGWTHSPVFDLEVSNNTLEDSWEGSHIGPEQGALTQLSRGRLYMTATIKDNRWNWSSEFLGSFAAKYPGKKPIGLSLGTSEKRDPGEFRVDDEGNTATPNGPSVVQVKARSATVNGRPLRGDEFSLGSIIRPAPAPRNASGTRFRDTSTK